MTLREYLKGNGIKSSWFAGKLGISPEYMSRIMSGSRYSGKPSKALRLLIKHETGGSVNGSEWDNE